MPTLNATSSKGLSPDLDPDKQELENIIEDIVPPCEDGLVFNFGTINKHLNPLDVQTKTADTPDPNPCSSSSTTSSSDSPNSVTISSSSTYSDSKLKDLILYNNHRQHSSDESKNTEQSTLDGDQLDHDYNHQQNSELDDEIRSRLDKLNALSDLINSLEVQFDEANGQFREILKCSTYRLSLIAKKLGSKSINYGRKYHAVKVFVEQSQSDCQKACVQFEKANNDHQYAREAIRVAESKLLEITSRSNSLAQTIDNNNIVIASSKSSDSLDSSSHDILKENAERLNRLAISDCTTPTPTSTSTPAPTSSSNDVVKQYSIKTTSDKAFEYSGKIDNNNQCKPQALNQPPIDTANSSPAVSDHLATLQSTASDDSFKEQDLEDATKLSESLNAALFRLMEAEQKRQESERLHLDETNKLIIAQEDLQKLEREHGNSIRKSQLYFDEANRFKARLNSVKSDIRRISDDIVSAKQAYAKTLRELEQFSEDLHLMSANAKQIVTSSDAPSSKIADEDDKN